MKTTQKERDAIRAELDRYGPEPESQLRQAVFRRLLDDADRCSELERIETDPDIDCAHGGTCNDDWICNKQCAGYVAP